MGDHLRATLAWCQQQSITSAVNKTGEVLPVSVADFLRLYADGAPPGLQHIISIKHQSSLFSALKASLPPDGKVRLDCCTHDYASLWLTTLPGNANLTLSDPDMRIAICLRLGIPPYIYDRDGPPVPCPSGGRGTKSCDVDMRASQFHGIHCIFQNKQGRNRMHNKVLYHLISLATQCKLQASATPKGFSGVDADGKKDQKQPDGIIDFTDGPTLFDVRGVDPLSPSHLLVNKNNSHAVSNAAAADKVKKYIVIANNKNVKLQPFVFTTLGGFHKSAVDFVAKILKNSTAPKKHKTLYSKLSELSVAIMRDNAAIVQAAHMRV